ELILKYFFFKKDTIGKFNGIILPACQKNKISVKRPMQLAANYRQIFKLAIPISVSLLIPQISFFANAAFLGRLGQLEMVANGLVSIFYLLLTYIGFGVGNG